MTEEDPTVIAIHFGETAARRFEGLNRARDERLQRMPTNLIGDAALEGSVRTYYFAKKVGVFLGAALRHEVSIDW